MKKGEVQNWKLLSVKPKKWPIVLCSHVVKYSRVFIHPESRTITQWNVHVSKLPKEDKQRHFLLTTSRGIYAYVKMQWAHKCESTQVKWIWVRGRYKMLDLLNWYFFLIILGCHMKNFSIFDIFSHICHNPCTTIAWSTIDIKLFHF